MSSFFGLPGSSFQSGDFAKMTHFSSSKQIEIAYKR
jgi:hypothetical protein